MGMRSTWQRRVFAKTTLVPNVHVVRSWGSGCARFLEHLPSSSTTLFGRFYACQASRYRNVERTVKVNGRRRSRWRWNDEDCRPADFGLSGAGTAAAQSGAAGFLQPAECFPRRDPSVRGERLRGYFSGGSPFGVSMTGIAHLRRPVVSGVRRASDGAGRERRIESGDSYSPSFFVSQTTLMSISSQRVSLNWNRKVGQKWSFNVGATGLVTRSAADLLRSECVRAGCLPTDDVRRSGRRHAER